MKHLKLFTFIFLTLVISCSDDDDSPTPINEEEVITTVNIELTPNGGGTVVTLQRIDTDGDDGPNPPETTVSGALIANTVYNGTIELLNETETPPENITLEVEEEAEEHQFFYTVDSGLNITTAYNNFDSNQDPLGTQFILTAGDASSGVLTFTLRHEPTKPNTGLSDAGGETDIEAPFDVTIE